MNWVEPAPAGAITSTAIDLAHFAMAHLDEGQGPGRDILTPAMARAMHETI